TACFSVTLALPILVIALFASSSILSSTGLILFPVTYQHPRILVTSFFPTSSIIVSSYFISCTPFPLFIVINVDFRGFTLMFVILKKDVAISIILSISFLVLANHIVLSIYANADLLHISFFFNLPSTYSTSIL